MSSARGGQGPSLFWAVGCAAVLVALVSLGALLTGFERDGWNVASTAALGLATSLVVGFWLRDGRPTEIWVGMFVAAIGLTFFMYLAVRFRSNPPRARIVYPTGFEPVPQFTKVAGIEEHLQDDRHLWVCLNTPYDSKNAYYCSSASKHDSGTWESDDINGFQVGTKVLTKETQPYRISVWLADRSLKDGAEGFKVKPTNAVQLHEIQVRRRQ